MAGRGEEQGVPNDGKQPVMSWWTYPLPKVAFDRTWAFGRTRFQPAGDVLADVIARREPVDDSLVGPLARWEHAREVATGWTDATVGVRAGTVQDARHGLAETVAALRFLMRPLVRVNVDVHRIGVPGEVDHAVLEYLVLADNGVAAAGWSLEDGPVAWRFDASTLEKWESEPGVNWLSNELSAPDEERTEAGRRAVIAVGLLDRAFLAHDPLTKVLLSALAVEAMFAAGSEHRLRLNMGLQIARRVGYLTCCGIESEGPVCPYIVGFKGQDEVFKMAQEWSSSNTGWQCSRFLELATPPKLQPYRDPSEKISLFGARNEAAHEGRTSADADTVQHLRWVADRALHAGITWFAAHPGQGVCELDAEIERAVARRGALAPCEPPPAV